MSKDQQELGELRRRLEAARVAEPDDGDTPRRAHVRKSLAAVMDYLRANGFDLTLTSPFQHLYAALEDAAEGRNNDLFALASVTRQRKTKKTMDTRQEIMASAAISLLIQERWTLPAASAYVANAIGMDRQELVTFRNNLMKRKYGAAAYHEFVGWLQYRKEFPNLSPVEAVKSMMENGRAIAKG